MKLVLMTAIALTTVCGFALPAGAAAILTGLTDDAQVAVTNPSNPTDGGGTVANTTAGSFSGGRLGSSNTYYNTVYVFQLPSVGAITNPFESASFSMTIQATNDIDAFNAGLSYDLYGLSARSASSLVLGSDFFLGGNDTTDATKIVENFITGANTTRFQNNVTKTTSAASLRNYLNAQYAGGAGAGSYIFLRVNLDGLNSSLSGISNYTANAANASYRPTITYTVPEPSSLLALAGLASIPLRRRSR